MIKPSKSLIFSCRLAPVAAVCLLVACASGGRNWARPGASEAQRDADFAACRSDARAATRRSDGIDQDITASRGGDWRKLGSYNSQESQLAAGDADDAARILGDCMSAKGYRPL